MIAVVMPVFIDEKWRLREPKSFAQILNHGIESGFKFM